MHDGDPGLRLIEPSGKNSIGYYKKIPVSDSKLKDKWMLIPVYHTFGSEPLSLMSQSVAERAPELYISVSSADAGKLSVKNGHTLNIKTDNLNLLLPCKIDDTLAEGTAGLPVIPGKIPFIPLPTTAVITGEKQ